MTIWECPIFLVNQNEQKTLVEMKIQCDIYVMPLLSVADTHRNVFYMDNSKYFIMVCWIFITWNKYNIMV